ncbi:hypothetical protein WT01_15805 [Burkholderia cepacia]|uniref:hypothetical protein n=1 Tax=Burkholderia cepacia TaxID=292 RepID=UPI000759AB25|nr:hypothetical protein [Burkholderia cepacia]KVL59292.1 hypothetical protein WT01_15805 [Burkholderia cepacia]
MDTIKPTEAQVTAFVQAYFSAECDGQVGRHIAGLKAALNVDPLASVVADLVMILEIIAADDDTARRERHQPLLTSGVRIALDAALIKAGRKQLGRPAGGA